MLLPTQISWVILAGGRASRMNGIDKGLVELNGKPLIEHVLSRLATQTDRIFINANRNADIYGQYGEVFADNISDYPGPLGGIHAALNYCDSDWVGFVPCDSPFISLDLVQRFSQQATDELDILVAHDGEYQQPVFTLYHKRVLAKLTAFLERGDRKIILLYKECRTHYVDFSDDKPCFINLNTLQELEEYGNISS
ncbi:molybdenum cofactor guanylyltransferase MobA [Vibrio sonorensis]|uniref:molybdenum cofactor guanylyltransferase MobA n=1 Tax=Vibrio sonorensis TaxID=1004316 RepID=UPI0008DB12C1|nr:molybdenum cofactor guanylyltransferase MobA [Vibrio sonorensis]